MYTQIALALLVLMPAVLGRPEYRERIPNGMNVKNPFYEPTDPNNDDEIWRGVGHWAIEGGGDRNNFGLDFEANGYQWTTTLCNLDSDTDGVTNGMELCDPDCLWTSGDPDPVCDSDVYPTHPGICEPVDTLSCEVHNRPIPDPFNCPDTEGADELEIVADNFVLPSKPTTYWCRTQLFPIDQDYHLVAVEPLIDSQYIHHIDIYGCHPEEYAEIMNKFGGDGADCEGLASMYCPTFLNSWTIGYPGMCLWGADYGYRLGNTSFHYGLVEWHYNNPQREENLEDSSGLKLYLTPELRTHDLGTLLVAELFLNVPANEERTEHAVCKGHCTERPVYPAECLNMIQIFIHMHLIGRAGKFYLKKANETLPELLYEIENYDYYAPEWHNFDTPVQICPGDEIITECTFHGRDNNRWVHYGEGAYEEMCIGYVSYYPQMPDAAFCTQVGEVDFCETYRVLGGTEERGCNFNEYMNSWALWSLVQEISAEPTCHQTGCHDTCYQLLRCAYPQHACTSHNDIRYTLGIYNIEAINDEYRLMAQKILACYFRDPLAEESISCARTRHPWFLNHKSLTNLAKLN